MRERAQPLSEGRPAASPTTASLQKMTEDDDAEAFLATMIPGCYSGLGWAQTGSVAAHPPDGRASSPCPPPADRLDYEALRWAVLEWVGKTPEGHRLRFRGMDYTTTGCPFTYTQQLQDAARWWIRPEVHTTDELIMMEQLLKDL